MPTPPMPAERRDLVHALLRRGFRRRAVAERAGVSERTVYRMLARLGGMARPIDVEYDRRYLTRDERYEIARLGDLGWSVRRVAARLGRAPSTVSRELRRNRHGPSGHYLPEHAHTAPWRGQRPPEPAKLSRGA